MGMLLGFVFANKQHVKSIKLCCAIFVGNSLFSCVAIFLAYFEESFQLTLFNTLVDFRPFIAPLAKIFLMAPWMGNIFLLWNGDFADSNHFLPEPLIRITGRIFLLWEGHLSVLNSLLSNRLFRITGKIAYSTFMVHYLLIWYQNANARHQRDFYALGLFCETVAHFFLSHLFGYLFYVIIEAPAANLLKPRRK